jgi:crotonobetainyl-CoA:carnitine CoA-transferase CaiB-like acyl-CoA transferase
LLPLIGDHLLSASVSGQLPCRWGNRSPQLAPQGVYRCGGDDAWLALTVRSDTEWRRLVQVLDRPRLVDPRWAGVEGRRTHHDAIDTEVTAWTSARGKFEAMAALQAEGIPAMAVLSNQDLVDGPQLQARGFIATIASGDAGHQRLPGASLHFSERTIVLGASPNLGQHNTEILTGLLGYDQSRIDRLSAAGTIAEQPPD